MSAGATSSAADKAAAGLKEAAATAASASRDVAITQQTSARGVAQIQREAARVLARDEAIWKQHTADVEPALKKAADRINQYMTIITAFLADDSDAVKDAQATIGPGGAEDLSTEFGNPAYTNAAFQKALDQLVERDAASRRALRDWMQAFDRSLTNDGREDELEMNLREIVRVVVGPMSTKIAAFNAAARSYIYGDDTPLAEDLSKATDRPGSDTSA